MATKVFALVAALVIGIMTILVAAEAQGFGVSGQSAPEKLKGICVVEADEVVGPTLRGEEFNKEDFYVVISERGRTPAFAKLQSFVVASHDAGGGDQVQFGGIAISKAYALGSRYSTRAPEATFQVTDPGFLVINGRPKAVDMIGQFGQDDNGNAEPGGNDWPIISQSRAGEVWFPFRVFNQGDAFDLNFIVELESPAGNLCSINIIPARLDNSLFAD